MLDTKALLYHSPLLPSEINDSEVALLGLSTLKKKKDFHLSICEADVQI